MYIRTRSLNVRSGTYDFYTTLKLRDIHTYFHIYIYIYIYIRATWISIPKVSELVYDGSRLRVWCLGGTGP